MSNNRNILIIDYQIGNVSSVINAVKKLGYTPVLSNSEISFKNASHIILPGVGSFEAGINNIEKLGLKKLILDQVLNKKKPILGICLGMQLFASEGHENKVIKKGLNLIEGKVELLRSKNEKLPHIGWNSVIFKSNFKLISNLESQSDFYFVHSYCFNCKYDSEVSGTTTYGSDFTSVVQKGNIIGTQFHPEKSLEKGLKLLDSFLNLNA